MNSLTDLRALVARNDLPIKVRRKVQACLEKAEHASAEKRERLIERCQLEVQAWLTSKPPERGSSGRSFEVTFLKDLDVSGPEDMREPLEKAWASLPEATQDVILSSLSGVRFAASIRQSPETGVSAPRALLVALTFIAEKRRVPEAFTVSVAKPRQVPLVSARVLAKPRGCATLEESEETLVESSFVGRWGFRFGEDLVVRELDRDGAAVEQVIDAFRHGRLPAADVARLRAEIGVPGRDELVRELGLDEENIRSLVREGKHPDVRQLFAKARQHLGLDALQSSFTCYQKAIGGMPSEGGGTWPLERKRAIATLLNAVARSLCARFVHDGEVGLLKVGGSEPGSFQLRAPGTPTIGQRLVLTLAPAPPDQR